MIPFGWVRDDGIRGDAHGYVWPDWTYGGEWLAALLRERRHGWQRYRIPRSTGQPCRVEVWCEAAGMHAQLARVGDRCGWLVYSGGGGESIHRPAPARGPMRRAAGAADGGAARRRLRPSVGGVAYPEFLGVWSVICD